MLPSYHQEQCSESLSVVAAGKNRDTQSWVQEPAASSMLIDPIDKEAILE